MGIGELANDFTQPMEISYFVGRRILLRGFNWVKIRILSGILYLPAEELSLKISMDKLDHLFDYLLTIRKK